MERVAVVERVEPRLFDVARPSCAPVRVDSDPSALFDAVNRVPIGVGWCLLDLIEPMLSETSHPVWAVRVLIDGDRVSATDRWSRVAVTLQVDTLLPPEALADVAGRAERLCRSGGSGPSPLVEITVQQVTRVDPAITRPLRQKVLRPHQTLDGLVVKGETAHGAAWFAALEGDAVVGTVGISPEESPDHPGLPAMRLRAMATDPAVRGMGLGDMLVAAATRHAVSTGFVLVWCSARTPAAGFYRRHGWTVMSGEYEVESIGPHVRMERRLR